MVSITSLYRIIFEPSLDGPPSYMRLSRGRAPRAGARIVRRMSGAYVPRSVTTVVISAPGVRSKRSCILAPAGQDTASKRASNLSDSDATQPGFAWAIAGRARGSVPRVVTGE